MNHGPAGGKMDPDRKVATILAADVVGYSRLMQMDEADTLAALNVVRRAFEEIVSIHGGEVFGSVGDSFMAAFPSVVNAVRCAVQIQARVRTLNDARAAPRRMELRIGLNLSDVIAQDGNLFGDGVNIAARLQALAAPGEVLLSGSVHEQVRNKVEWSFARLGRRSVRNIAEPISVYRLIASGPAPLPDRARDFLLRHRMQVLAGAALLVAVAAGSWWYATRHTNSDARRPIVAVAPIQNLTGRRELDWLGDGLASLVRDRLAQSRYLQTASRGWWLTIAGTESNPAALYRRAAHAGIDFVVSGELLAAPDGLILTNRVTNLHDGSDVVSQTFERLDEQQVIGAAARLSVLAKQALRVPQTEQVDTYAADFAVRNLGAYQAYVSGLKFLQDWHFKEAEQSMRAALELAPDFHMARYRLALVRYVQGWRSEARAIMRAIPASVDIGRRERLYITAAATFFQQDFAAAITAYRKLLSDFPHEVEARQKLAETYFHARQDDAAIAELRALGEAEPQNEEVWNQLTAYLTIAGRLDEAEAANKVHRRLSPGDPHPLTLEADILKQRGKLDAAQTNYLKALGMRCGFEPAVMGLAEVSAMRGSVAPAVALYAAITEDDDMEMEERLTAVLNLAALLRAQGKLAESSALLVKSEPLLMEEGIRIAVALALRARNAFDLGDRSEALRLAHAAVEKSPAQGVPTRYLHTLGLLQVGAGDLSGAAQSIQAIRSHALPPTDPDRTEEKAAAHLEGLIALAAGDAQRALAPLQSAVNLGGYRYALYEVDLARALIDLHRIEEARAMLDRAIDLRDANDPRIDLEPERARANELVVQLAQSTRQSAEATRAFARGAARWGPAAADPAAPLIAKALERCAR